MAVSALVKSFAAYLIKLDYNLMKLLDLVYSQLKVVACTSNSK